MRVVLLTLLLASLSGCVHPKPVLGGTATVRVVEADLEFRGRVDTGAEASSIHALHIERVAQGEGEHLRFVIANERGEAATLIRPLADVAEVRGATGQERRFRVALTLAIGSVQETVLVTLRDRSRMNQKLLVGRDLLAGRFLVDVEIP